MQSNKFLRYVLIWIEFHTRPTHVTSAKENNQPRKIPESISVINSYDVSSLWLNSHRPNPRNIDKRKRPATKKYPNISVIKSYDVCSLWLNSIRRKLPVTSKKTTRPVNIWQYQCNKCLRCAIGGIEFPTLPTQVESTKANNPPRNISEPISVTKSYDMCESWLDFLRPRHQVTSTRENNHPEKYLTLSAQ